MYNKFVLISIYKEATPMEANRSIFNPEGFCRLTHASNSIFNVVSQKVSAVVLHCVEGSYWSCMELCTRLSMLQENVSQSFCGGLVFVGFGFFVGFLLICFLFSWVF